MEVIHADNSGFNKVWRQLYRESDLQIPFYQPWNIQYYDAMMEDTQSEDRSFIVEEKGHPLVGLRMSLGESEKRIQELTGFGLPIYYIENRKMTVPQCRRAQKRLKTELDILLKENSVSSIRYQDFLDHGMLSFLGKFLLSKGAEAVPYFTEMVDLSPPEADLFRQVRKSYKSLINWGMKNLNLRVLESENTVSKDIDGFRELHLEVAGRKTRPDRTWELQYQMICHNEAFAILGELEGALVTAGLFPISPRYCYYGVSASKRELFSKPLSHAVIWNAIVHAKQRGCRYFETGTQVYPNQGEPPPTQKELAIGTFKRGFGGQSKVRLDIHWKR